MAEEFIESCWFIYGVWIGRIFIGRLIYHSSGTSGQVEFDWKRAMNPFLIGWMHTHPKAFGVKPSSMDESVMRGWVRARGSKMLCGILSEEGTLMNWLVYFRHPDRSIGWLPVSARRPLPGVILGGY